MSPLRLACPVITIEVFRIRSILPDFRRQNGSVVGDVESHFIKGNLPEATFQGRGTGIQLKSPFFRILVVYEISDLADELSSNQVFGAITLSFMLKWGRALSSIDVCQNPEALSQFPPAQILRVITFPLGTAGSSPRMVVN